ncbi:hypothetical protein SPRG_04181 [Saprolegnia parasitica CBS 223.65]|uniref:DM2 domain-containing protein n=1 Tax=Saprolegnia parasitica (strain CBS 223.65) TaxID=695850 RepID=A0A067CKD6_SAPPC|nr:hypothetical protein SPRG_04181 [Saprolegnia parasitica CBS 223.65]KDO30993.1 hypothetical protein SPRG_04181 [Saprolegnia parasitica CBS 223.65]|eukprot:XP_012198177.1 hypothetical protein SPRG_04181 [Saprolegnia parasitica CBS 223.65]
MAEESSSRKRRAVALLREVESVDPEQYATLKQLKAMDDHASGTIHRNLRRLEALAQAPPKMTKATLVVTMTYSHDPSAVVADASSDKNAGQWTFRVQASIEGGLPCSKSFSHFFRKAIVELDERMYPQPATTTEWSSFRSGDESDGFEVTRPGKAGVAEHTLRLQLVRQLSPERFNVSPDLFAALAPYLAHALPEAQTRQDVLKAAWDYIKMKDLLHIDDCRVIVNDAPFERVFECKEMPFQSLAAQLQKHLTPTRPSTSCRTLGTLQENRVIDEQRFHVEIPLCDDLDRVRKTCLARCARLDEAASAETDRLQTQMNSIVREINRHVTRHAWMTQFAKDPITFMDRVVASQDTDQELLALETTSDTSDASFRGPWVHSTMEMLLQRD